MMRSGDNKEKLKRKEKRKRKKRISKWRFQRDNRVRFKLKLVWENIPSMGNKKEALMPL